ncbi:homoserine kinase [Enterobacteriaceae endosymbiont of Macroplea mutica]|uniref:homoserine kinase n=1 Tax=Enterobacteriaceae endosymbiont of Macroplea mutica TaxID=2675791 RepID=UPI001448D624|nr:homoserine kinase [Enterobacteriaceae endosymbiont of Macroplea mutica]QJC31385.1 homoserine kinase [Enterobacteriaceae endosymbiont of Macroplea mutica]
MIKIYSPASIGNINVGFDSLGIALTRLDNGILGDYVTIIPHKTFTLMKTGLFIQDLPEDNENIIFHCWLKFCDKINKTIPVKVLLEKNVPVASGLGSSACSIVSFLKAMNIFCEYPLTNTELIILMGELEGLFSGNIHYDNIIPCYLGGMKLILSMKHISIQDIPIFSNWLWVIAYPGISLSTYNSRKILPNTYTLETCIQHSQYLSGFIHASHIQNEILAAKLLKDHIAEPYRKNIIPNFNKVKNKAKQLGALNYGIAGSGPTIFCIFNHLHNAQDMVMWLKKYYIQNHKGFVYICTINKVGTQIMEKI